MVVEQFLQFSDDEEDITGTSHPIVLKQPIEGRGHKDSNWGRFPLFLYEAAGLAGSIEGVLADPETEDADIDDATGLWETIDGGDLATWAGGGCTAMFAPFTHIRLNVSAGTTKARIWK